MGRRKKAARRAGRAGSWPHGRLELTRHGYGFVETDEGTFYISRHGHRGAMHGDEVEVRPANSPKGRAAGGADADAGSGGAGGSGAGGGVNRKGRIVRVMQRNTEYLTAILHIEPPLAVARPTDPRFFHDIFVSLDECPQAQAGDVVLVRLLNYPSKHVAASGYVVEVVGAADQPGMDIDVLVHNAGLLSEFGASALFEAEQAFVDEEGAAAEAGRRDLRSRCVFTIDPADAKDFDDALSFDRVEGLCRVGVHIADVSAYVPVDSSVDLAARARGCSTYLPDRVLPMLPEALCNNICSLRPGVARLCVSCDMFFDDAGGLVRFEIFPSLIRSSRRFCYDEVDEVLAGGGLGGATAGGDGRPAGGAAAAGGDDHLAGGATASGERLLHERLFALHKFAEQRIAAAWARGTLDFNFPEPKPVLDEDGHCVEVRLRSSSPATRLVEECMVAANECVALHLQTEVKRGLYRTHAAPGPSALEALLPTLKQLGLPIEGLGGGKPAAYQRVLAAACGLPCQSLVETLVLRSQEQARYGAAPLGHFGLALKHYTHFTSPIRRYPDLVVHRLLKDGGAHAGQLEYLAEHCSKMERLSEETTRQAVALKICEHMSGRVGELFVGTISSVLARGFYVRLDNCAEGFVKLGGVSGEYFEFDPVEQTLVGEESRRAFRLGQRVRVRLQQACVQTCSLEFGLD